MSDKADIVNVINLYAAALDAHQYDWFDEIFTPDTITSFGGGAGWSDRDALKTGFKAIHAVFAATQHIVSGHAIVLGGDRAKCLSHVDARFVRVIDGQRAVFASTGWYDDKLIRTPSGWRIAERLSRMVTASGDLRVMQAMPGVNTEYTYYSLAEEAAAGRVGLFV